MVQCVSVRDKRNHSHPVIDWNWSLRFVATAAHTPILTGKQYKKETDSKNSSSILEKGNIKFTAKVKDT